MTDQTYDYSTGAGSAVSGATLMGTLAFDLVLLVVSIVVMWRIFEKAGKPGWASIIPIYNIIVLLEIVGRPWWWLLLMFVPFVNIVMIFLLGIALAKAFGRSTAFGVVACTLFSLIGYAILAFGKDKYVGPTPLEPGGPAPAAPTPPAPTPAA
jgi:hypothetical protein